VEDACLTQIAVAVARFWFVDSDPKERLLKGPYDETETEL
jgi:hypothetical protein